MRPGGPANAGGALLWWPAQEAVAGCDLPCAGGEAHEAEDAGLAGGSQVTELSIGVMRWAEVAPAGDQLAPEGGLGLGGDGWQVDRAAVAATGLD